MLRWFHVEPTGIVCNDSPVTGILDTYGDAFAAYSLYKLRNAYTGPCMRVRKVVGGGEQDIGWNNGYICVQELEDFADGGDLTVSIWYNQTARTYASGRAIHLFRNGSLIGPIIAESGVFSSQGVKLRNINDDALLSNNLDNADWSFAHNGTRYLTATALLINESSTSNNIQWIYGNSNGTAAGRGVLAVYENRAVVGVTNCMRSYAARGSAPFVYETLQSNTLAPNTDSIIVIDSDGTNATPALRCVFDVNSTSYSPNSLTGSPIATSANFRWALGSNIGLGANGYIKEHIVWDTDKSGSASGIRDNINSRWNIY